MPVRHQEGFLNVQKFWNFKINIYSVIWDDENQSKLNSRKQEDFNEFVLSLLRINAKSIKKKLCLHLRFNYVNITSYYV